MLQIFRVLIVLCCVFCAGGAKAEGRIALIIGNGGYTSVTPLRNPVADAGLIAETLAGLGFQVTSLLDASQEEMKQAVSEFGKALRAAGPEATGLFYYAGHGVQSFGTNYLLPVDTALSDPADLDLVAIEADSVLRQMRSARNRTNIVILDACRNNPFEALAEYGEDGLAEMKAPTGTYLAFATAPGDVALDGQGANSPFTAALAREMTVPGAPIEAVFKEVRRAVLDETGGSQTPWDASSLTADFSFTQSPVPAGDDLAEQQLWEMVVETRDPVQIMLFLKAYPTSPLEPRARALLAEVMAQELAPASGGGLALAPAPPPVQPSADEEALIAKAQASGLLDDYLAYRDAYPDGAYIELAEVEISILEAQAAEAAAVESPPAEEEVAALAPETPAPEPTRAAPAGPVTFLEPLTIGGDAVMGLTLAELIEGTPLFPPIEGIPEELWKDQSCSNCHQWTREALCTQAQFYLGDAGARSLDKSHPYGGGLKMNMRSWAEAGCQ